MRKVIWPLVLTAALAACATSPGSAPWPAVPVMASGETAPVGTGHADAADDPAIWRNGADPAASLIVATDKKAGLYLYGLDGKVRDFDPDGRLNNVALADMGATGVIVAASDRNDPSASAIRLYRLDTAAAKLVRLGAVPSGAGEGYGMCVLARADGLHAFAVIKDGTIREFRIELGAAPSAILLRSMKLASQAEGCVADPRDGALYVGEEDVGIWRFDAGETTGQLMAKADGQSLVADVEGLALLPQGEDGGWLIASSQGDSTYAAYALPDMKLVGRFRIAEGRFGATEETDGIDVSAGSFGAQYPDGLFVAQDGDNQDRAQNFKLVSWQAIIQALKGWTRPAKKP